MISNVSNQFEKKSNIFNVIISLHIIAASYYVLVKDFFQESLLINWEKKIILMYKYKSDSDFFYDEVNLYALKAKNLDN